MSIVIFGDLFAFPEGNAATNRVYTYAKGFQENGIDVHVICFSNEYTDNNNGIIDGIKYYHPFERKKRSPYFIVRRWQKLVKYVKTYHLVRKINGEGKIVAINSWTNLLLTHLFGWLLSKFWRAKLIAECSEHPLRFYQHGTLKRKKGAIKFYIESHLCDGIFCISHFLVDFYKSRGVAPQKLFQVPSTVDPGRFIDAGEKPISYPYIGYFGSLTFKRDNVDLLIRAFAVFSHLHSEVYLVLGGFCRENEKRQILELATELNILPKVLLLEYLTREEVIKYIVHAEILVMVRSDDMESRASYPSKLTEFLATSRPVVTVNVGEISDYLTDGINSFIVEPGNAQALAVKLDFIINNYDYAKKVGQRGKELTAGIFNYNYQAKRMIGFINSLNNSGNGC